MKFGRIQDFIFLLVGALFFGLHLLAIEGGYVFPVMAIGVPVFGLMGIAFLVFPGSAAGSEARKNPAVFWNGGSKTDKVMWIASFVVGLAAGLYWFFTSFDIENLV